MINTHPTKCNICGGRVTYGSNAVSMDGSTEADIVISVNSAWGLCGDA